MSNERHTSDAFGSGSSLLVEKCQVCGGENLEPILFVGYLPPVNQMWMIGHRLKEQPAYPTEVLRCKQCHLVQLGTVVDAKILFPPEYPYTSGTTRILRENFKELYQECTEMIPLSASDLIVDVGSNDGTLLSNFSINHRVLGIEPTDAGKLAIDRNIDTLISFFNKKAVEKAVNEHGRAKIVTATNVFAHMENIGTIVENIKSMLCDDGVFISESHYLLSLVETLQYDTIYHEHLRYYSLHSLNYLLEMFGLEVFFAKRIPTHGGSIRVYSARKGQRHIDDSVKNLLKREKDAGIVDGDFSNFKQRVALSKLKLYSLLYDIKRKGQSVYGIGAPSRASTLINYVGIDDTIMDCVLEIRGSHKIGKYMPGTMIPVLDEKKLFDDQPDYALLLSWHIGEALAYKLKDLGFKGKFIVPLPEPKILNIGQGE